MTEQHIQTKDEISPVKQQELLSTIQTDWYPELKRLLPELKDLSIQFDNQWLIADSGTGGFANTTDKITLAFDPNFTGNKDEQLNDLRGSYYHEAYHTVQGFIGEDDNRWTPLENAIYEGAATKFEMIHAQTNPGWGKYNDEIIEFLPTIANLSVEEFEKDWRRWKFYDPESNTRWIMYRVGSYIVDEALKNSGLSIQELTTTPAFKILELSKVGVE